MYIPFLAAAFLAFVLFAFLPAFAAFNPEINYQGKLTNSSGELVADGAYDMEFRLYTTATSGTPIYTEIRTGGNQVNVTSGLFSVLIGDMVSLTGIDFDQPLYLGVTIGGDAEMSPRKALGAVPAAFVADTLDGLDSTDFVRSNATTSIATSSADTLLTITQTGTGDILNLFDGGTEVFSIIDGGNVGLGTTTPSARLSVDGDLSVTGAIRDSNGATGLNTFVLMSTGAGTQWVSTTTLGLAASGASTTFISLTDTPNSYTANRLFFANAAGNAVTDSNDLVFSGGQLGIGTSSPSDTLTVVGSARITGALRDSLNSAGTNGQLLSSTGVGTQYISTSTLNINSDDLVEGSINQFFSNALSDARFAVNLAATTTDALSEGVTNRYYSDALVSLYITGSTSLLSAPNEAGLESYLTDVTNVFTNNDGALSDDDLSDNTTTDLAEGINLYFTTARASSTANQVLSATTSLPGITSLSSLAAVGTITSGVWQGTAIDGAFIATSTLALSTDDITEANNLYYTDARVSSYIAGSSTISLLGQSIDLASEVTGTLATTSIDADVLVTGEIDTEAELEALLGDVTDVFTNNDGALTDDDLSNNTTTDLAEGTNLYFTNARSDARFAVNLAATTTDALSEGSSNFYFTTARASNTTNQILSATTSLPNLTTLANLTTVGTLTTGTLDFNTLATVGRVASTSLDVAVLLETELDTEAELEALLSDVSNVFTDNDTIGSANIADVYLFNSGDTASGEYTFTGTTTFATTTIANLTVSSPLATTSLAGEVLVVSEVNSEAELEALLADVANVFTNTDGALSDDDLSDDSINALSDVTITAAANGEILSYNGSAWVDVATSTLGIALADTTGTLAATRGGTGLSAVTQNQLLIGGPGNTWTQVATSSLGLGTVTSVGFSVPTGLAVAGTPITGAGTIALTYDTGYAAVLTASTTNWNNFYDTPSTVITDGAGLTWSGNTLNLDNDFGASIDESELNISGAPTDGFVLQASSTSAGGFVWVATSSLGFADTQLSESEVEAFIFDADNSGTLSSGTLALDSLSFTGTLATTSIDADVLVTGEIDTEAELEALLGDVTDVFTNNDGALTDDDLSNNTTTDLAEGTNLYFTNARSDARFAVNLAATTTDALSEGSSNFYFTTARASNTTNQILSATTSLPNLTTLANLTTVGTLTTGTLDFNTLATVGRVASTSLDVAVLLETELDTEAELEALLSDVSNVFTDNDTIGSANIADVYLFNSGDTASGEYTFTGTTTFATTTIANLTVSSPLATTSLAGEVLVVSEVNSEAELEALLADVANVFTNTDGALSDDDLSDDSINALSDVTITAAANGEILSYNGSAWVDVATSTLGIALADTTGTLAATRGGTGLSAVTQNQLLIGGPGNTWTQVATSSLGLGTVTSVGFSVPTGLAVAGTPITGAGTIALTYDTGYAAVLTASTTNWNNFYDTPSTVITDGAGLTWSGNTLNLDNDFGASIDESELNISGAPTDGFVLQASSTSAGGFVWVATSSLGFLTDISGSSISALADVDTTGAVGGNILVFDGTNWVDAATTTFLMEDELNTETELESLLGDVTNVFTNNDTITSANIDNVYLFNTGDAGGGEYTFTGTNTINVLIATSTTFRTALGETSGGTGQDTYTTGDILYASGPNTLSRLAAGGDGTVLRISAGIPTWGAAGGAGSSFWSTTTNNRIVYPADPTDIVLVGGTATTSAGYQFEVIGASLFDSAQFDAGVTTTVLSINSERFDDLTGDGLTNSGEVLTVDCNALQGTGISCSSNNFQIEFTEFDADSISEGTTNFFSKWVDDGGPLYFTGGNVGIGSTNYDARLHVRNTAGQDSFLVEDQASDPTPFVIDLNGNVGIGDASPSSKLSVIGSVFVGDSLRATGTVQFDALTNGLLLADSSGNVSTVATSSLGLTTDDITEGSNLYYTDGRVSAYISGSSSILVTATEAGLESYLTDVINVFTNNDGALNDDDLSNNTTTDLAEGTNLYFTNDRVSAYIAGSSTISLLGQTISANELANADFGDFTCNGTTCSFDASTVASSTLNATNWTDEYVLQASSTAAGGFAWVATSSLGFVDTDTTLTTGTDNQIPFVNAAGTDLEYSANFTFDGSTLAVQTTATNDILNLFETGGTEVFTVLENGRVGVGTTSPVSLLDVWGNFRVGTSSTPLLSAETQNNLIGVMTDSPVGRVSISTTNLDQTWEQIGNALDVGAAGNPTLTAMSANRVAQVDRSTDELRMFEFDGTNWAQVGNGLSLSLGADQAITALNESTIAFANPNNTLKAYEFNGSDWIETASLTRNITGDIVLTTLGSDRVVFGASLQVYDLVASSTGLGTWQAVGNTFSPSGGTNRALTALSPNRVAFIGDTNDTLGVYEFDGNDWSTIATTSVSVGIPYLTTMSPNRVALLDGDTNELRVYEFNGVDFVLVGSGLNIGDEGAIAAISPNRIAVVDGTNNLRTYQFSNPGFFVGNDKDYPYLSVSDNGFTSIETLAVNAGLVVSAGATGTDAIMGTSSPALVVNGDTWFGGDLLPTSNVIYDLGAENYRFSSGWFETLNVGTSTWSIFNGSNGRFAISSAAEQGGTEYFSIATDGNVSLATTTANSARLSVQTSGTTDILNLFETGGTEVFTVLENGNVGIGTTTPARDLAVDGDVVITGALYDATNDAGTNGEILQSTGAGLAWVATSSLGISGDGGDAATIDGLDSTQFLRSDQADTATGLLTFSGGFVSQSSSTITGVTLTTATTTNFVINGELFTDLTGSGLSNIGGALTLDTSGDWTGTIDGNNFAGGAVAAGDLLYGSGVGEISELSIGGEGAILTVSGGLPTWSATSTLGLGDGTFTGLQDVAISSLTANRIPFTNAGASALADSADFAFNDTTDTLTVGGMTISDGLVTFSTGATTTVPDNNPFAFTIATSTTGVPYFRIDTTVGVGAINIGSGAGDVFVGDVGSPSNLVFEESSTISGQGTNVITLGVAGDTFNVAPGTAFNIGTTSQNGLLTVSSSTASTIATFAQYGTGDILNVFDGASEVLTVLDGGNVGIGTSTPGRALSVAGDMVITGALYDNDNSAGTNGMVLQSNGSGFQWVATSSLGISGGGADAGTLDTLDSTQFLRSDVLNATGSITDLFTENATTTRLSLGGDTLTDLTGTGLTVVGGTLNVSTSSLYASGVITDGGNSFGETISIGSNDDNDVSLIRNGTERVSLSATGISLNTATLTQSGSNPALNISRTNSASPLYNIVVSGTGSDTSTLTIGTGLTFDYDGTDIFRADGTTGNFGIGTTSPEARLTVRSTSTNDILNLFESDGLEVFTVLENGRVGIGTNTPSSLLSINGGVGSLGTGLSFGDGDTGIYESSDDVLVVDAATRVNLNINSSTYFQVGAGYAGLTVGNSPRFNSATGDVPNILPGGTDTDTGIGNSK